MGKLFRAIICEHRKLWQKKSACLCLVIVIVLSSLCAVLLGALDEAKVELPMLSSTPHGSGLFGSETLVEQWIKESEAEKAEEEEPPKQEQAPIPSQSDVSGSDVSASDVSASDSEAQQEQESEPEREPTVVESTFSATERLAKLREKLLMVPDSEKYRIEKQIEQLTRAASIDIYRQRYSLPATDESDWRRFVLVIWLLTPIVAVFAIGFCSDIFAGEYGRGTIRMVLSRPITRIKQYAAKVITAAIFTAILMWVMYLFALLASGELDNNATYVGYINGNVYKTTWINHSLAVLLCNYITVMTAIMLCAMVGNMTRSRAASALSAVALLMVSLLAGEALGSTGSAIIGLLIPVSLDLSLPLEGVANCATLGFSHCAISVGLHLAAFTMAGYMAFRRDAQ